jgi:hypothetical protein
LVRIIEFHPSEAAALRAARILCSEKLSIPLDRPGASDWYNTLVKQWRANPDESTPVWPRRFY